MRHFWFYTGPAILLLTVLLHDAVLGALLLGFETWSLGWHQRIHHPETWLAKWPVRAIGLLTAITCSALRTQVL